MKKKTVGNQEKKIDSKENQRQRPQLFEFPALNKWESLTYFAIIITGLSYAFYQVYVVSSTFQFQQTRGRFEWSDLPFFGRRMKDTSNWEWRNYAPFALTKLLPMWLAHIVAFNALSALVDRGWIRQSIVDHLVTLVDMGAACFAFNPYTVAASALHGLIVFLIAVFTRRRMGVWLSAVPIMWSTMHNPLVRTHEVGFVSLLLMSYRMLSYISFNIDMLDGRCRPSDDTWLKRLCRMYSFSFYSPYLVSVIVLYHDWERQLAERDAVGRDWRQIAIYAARLAFWFAFIEFLLHFFYFEAILYSVPTLYAIREDQLCAMGFSLGVFFHMKYVVIFGLPAVFAKIDRMQPPDGPVCISRVALFSKMWRNFDRGLYNFFKHYIFLPICAPSFSIPRKALGMMTAYAFVLAWHGVDHNNIVWIVLNLSELFMEITAKSIYAIKQVRIWREAYIGDRMFRRFLCWLIVPPYAFALYSTFYFLAGSEAGYVYVDRIFWQETVPVNYPFITLVCFGYCYSNISIDSERWVNEKKKIKAA